MSPRYATPAFFVDEIYTVETTPGGRVLIEMDSIGTPIRLTLSLNLIMKLGRMATKAGNELMNQQTDSIIKLPRRRKRKVSS